MAINRQGPAPQTKKAPRNAGRFLGSADPEIGSRWKF